MSFLGDITGGLLDSSSQRRTSRRNIRYQREFAQNAIQWRTDDAVAAGVHPLFAMGANTTSFQPGIPQSGSAAGDAVRRIDRGFENKAIQKAQIDLIEEQIKTSQWRREVDRSNTTQDTMPLSQYLSPGFERKKVIAMNPITHGKTPLGTIEMGKRMSAQQWEDQYGDIAQEVGGFLNLTSDIQRQSTKAIANWLARKYNSTKGQRDRIWKFIRHYKSNKQLSMDPFINYRKKN